jgi:hypothetical protein
MHPRGELRVAAELSQPRAELHQRLLCRVARVFDVAHELGRKLVHPRGVPLDQRIERAAVAFASASHERDVAEPPVRGELREGDVVDQTGREALWLHGGVRLHDGR